MSEALGPKFSCAACGRAFRWNPQIAGKRAKCKCGQTVQVPASPPAPPAPPGVASSAETPPPPPPVAAEGCPSCGAAMAPGAVLCVACGYNVKTGRRLGAPAVTSEPEDPAPPPPPAPAAPGGAAGAAGAYAGTFRRAKVDEVTTAEEQGSSWKGYVSILVGLVFVGLAVWQVIDPTDFSTVSTSGGRRGRAFKALLKWVYSLGGTWAVVGLFALIALLFILGGLATVLPSKKDREEAAG